MTPEFDTEEWRALRDRKMLEWTNDINVIWFIRQFGDICEVFDDLIDKDRPVTDADITRVLFVALTELPLNPFFDKYKHQLVPIIVTGINAWLDANKLEKGSQNDRVFAYVLRDWYAEIVAYCVYLCRGRDYMQSVSMEVRGFFTHHETLEQYRETLP